MGCAASSPAPPKPPAEGEAATVENGNVGGAAAEPSLEERLLAAINKARAASGLPAVALFPDFGTVAGEKVKQLAEDGPIDNEGFKERAEKVFGAGRAGYQETIRRAEFDDDPAKGDQEFIESILTDQKTRIAEDSLTEIGVFVMKKEGAYSWVLAFIAKSAKVAKGNKDDVRISTAQEDQQVIDAINKVRVGKKLNAVALLDGYHEVGDAHVSEIVTGAKELSADGNEERAEKVFAGGSETYSEALGLLTGAGDNAVAEAIKQILKQQTRNIGEPETTHVGVVIAMCGETTVWIACFTQKPTEA